MEPSHSSPSAELPQPKDLSHLLSRSTRNRNPSSIKRFYKYFSIPGIGQLAGGLPNPSYFPYDNFEANVALPNRWQPTPLEPVDPPSKDASTSTSKRGQPSARIEVPMVSRATEPAKKIDLTSALQYGTAQGYLPLQNLIRQFTRENLHPNVPYAGGPDIILTVGATDGFAKAIQAFQNEWSAEKDPLEEKEGLLVEQFAYMNAIQAARPRGMNIVPVKMDDEGIIAEGQGGLQDVLEKWDTKQGKRPHLMYTVACGQNPTGSVLSLSRKKALYDICSKYDIIIIEDEPYWFLQYPSSHPKRPNATTETTLPDTTAPTKSSGYPYLDSLVPSYLAVDTDGRVVRLDTFSKTIAPGCRMGWITAQPALIERLLRITETSTQQPSGFVQSLVAELLLGPSGTITPEPTKHGKRPDASQGWHISGWVRWLEGLRGAYERRMQLMCSVLDTGRHHVKSGTTPSLDADWGVVTKVPILSFQRPMGGMFVWIEVLFANHPLFRAGEFTGPELATALWVFWTRVPYLVLASPGTIFAPTQEVEAADAWRFFRLCFAACEEVEVEGLSRRVVSGLEAFWMVRRREVVEKLLDEANEESVEMETGGVTSLAGPC
ncbi:MAG: hypothetical protein M1828_002101 [Chrysothrix sp. TS-e1954]|nr:MAG: hypothetical protein M1828_002101 [Chrysothrix sp. TS-e1954]